MASDTLVLAAAGAVTVSVALVVIGLSRRVAPDRARMPPTRLGGEGQAKDLEELELSAPAIDRILFPVLRRMASPVARISSSGFVAKTTARLAQAGSPHGLSVTDWMGIKALASIVMSVFMALAIGMPSSPIMALAMAGAGLLFGYIGPEFWLGGKVKARKQAIILALPDALDLMTISVRAGLGFDAALAKVIEKTEGPLADEFRRALAEVRVGRPRREAMRDIIGRTDVPPLSSFISAIIQAERLGVTVSKVLVVQSEQQRMERRQRAEEQAAKAPIKMLLPLVGCIFPALFIVLLGPAVIMIMKSFSHM
jgi:tight adherence protein C